MSAIAHARARAFSWGRYPNFMPVTDGGSMTSLEKKLCRAMNGLVVDMIKLQPALRKPLEKIQRVLLEMVA